MSIIKISSISQLHQLMGLPRPHHPLVSLIDVSKIQVTEEQVNTKVIYDFYMVSLKDKSFSVKYGRNSFDFDEGIMIFTAPGQVFTLNEPFKPGDIKGWMLFFHPDLVRSTHLGEQVDHYSFFNYDVVEALHLSEEEERTINTTVAQIEKEYQQRIDNHSHRVIVSNIELLLNYCLRFYERQFHTRTNQSKNVISVFESELKKYFKTQKNLDLGIPSIQYFAEIAHLSPHYFSDLVKKETGRSPKDHINDYVIEQAKNMLISSERSVSEIAYELGFNYPHYFTRLFKSKVGCTPIEYRNLN